MLSGIAWVVAVVLGLTVGGFAFHFPGGSEDWSWSVSAGLFGLLIGAVNGVLVGAFAWMALRLCRRTGWPLVIAMVMIVGGTHALNDGASIRVQFPVIQALAAILVAASWAVVMRERRPAILVVVGGAWWVGLILAARSGDMVGLPWSETPIGWAMDHAWDGLVTGIVWGVATAAVGVPSSLRARRGAQQASDTLRVV
jgi:hypothetical protein